MKWLRKWTLRLLVVLVLAGAARHAYVSGMVATTVHDIEQMALRRSSAVLMAKPDGWETSIWRQPVQMAFDWLWERSTSEDRAALRRYWQLREIDVYAQATDASATEWLEALPGVTESPLPPLLDLGGKSPIFPLSQ
jgi:hypothetical protein